MEKTIRATAIAATLLCFSTCNYTLAASPSVTAKENLQTLIQTNSCKGCDLSGLKMNRLNLAGADLEGADMSLSSFYLANLSGANLKNCKLNGAIFGGADLGDADLTGADLRGAKLDTAYLVGAAIDGEFVPSKPYEDIGVDEVEKEAYVDDQTKPKKSPQESEVSVAPRRDISETPPAMQPKVAAEVEPAIEKIEEIVEKVDEPAPETVVPVAPQAKKVSNVQPVIVEEKKQEKSLPALEPAKKAMKPAAIEKENVIEQEDVVVPKEEDKEQAETGNVKEEAAEPKVTVAPIASAKDPVAEKPVKEVEKQVQTVVDSSKMAAGEAMKQATDAIEDLASDKAKRDNLSKLLDDNRCYGCDLSGLDLSGKDLEGADLEKADLSGANLEKADLEEANLKGANLTNAILRDADLEETDFYKADLTGADLTGAKKKNTMFDGANVEKAIGITQLSIIKN